MSLVGMLMKQKLSKQKAYCACDEIGIDLEDLEYILRELELEYEWSEE